MPEKIRIFPRKLFRKAQFVAQSSPIFCSSYHRWLNGEQYACVQKAYVAAQEAQTNHENNCARHQVPFVCFKNYNNISKKTSFLIIAQNQDFQ
jgi:hypothetical protein